MTYLNKYIDKVQFQLFFILSSLSVWEINLIMLRFHKDWLKHTNATELPVLKQWWLINIIINLFDNKIVC